MDLSFREKIDDWRDKLVDKRILHRDMQRFVLVVVFLLLLGVINKLENNNQQIREEKNISRQSVIFNGLLSRNKDHFAKMYDLELMNKIVADFGLIDQEKEFGLGNYISDKNGYLQSYDNGNNKFEVFVPDYFGENTVITSNDVTLLIQPLGFDEEKSRSVVSGNKLIYDEIFPHTTVVKNFTEKGLKEYIYLKSSEAPYIYNYRLNASTGNDIGYDNGQIIVFDENKEVKIVLNKAKIYDAKLKLLNDIKFDLLSENILEIRFDNRENLDYPLLIDFGS